MLAEFVRRPGSQGVGIDTPSDPLVARRELPGRVAIQGNLDPLALVAGGRGAGAAKSDAILAAMRGRPFIFNLGHGIVPATPPEHVAALVARRACGLSEVDGLRLIRPRIAVVLFNLGGPDRPESIRPFLVQPVHRSGHPEGEPAAAAVPGPAHRQGADSRRPRPTTPASAAVRRCWS